MTLAILHTDQIDRQRQRAGETLHSWATLTYSARRYDSAVCCSKMSRDAILSEALYEADKAKDKDTAAPRECACLQGGGRSRW